MALSNAERQARYREKRKAGRNDESRLNTFIDSKASAALLRLAQRYGVTKREMLERLIIEADAKVSEGLHVDSPEWLQYYDVTQ